MRTISRFTIVVTVVSFFSFLLAGCGRERGSDQVISKSNEPQPVISPRPTMQAPSPNKAGKIETLSNFESSEFFRRYSLSKGKGWKLRTGEFNNDYNMLALRDIIFGVTTLGDEVTGYGIVFYEREWLGDVELAFVFDLLRAIDSNVKLTSSVKEYIKTNAERSLFQIKEATPITFGKFKIYAGKVGPEQTISIEKV
jgi:hypothetical protein